MTSEQSALNRLALSRERLRQALDDASTPRHEWVHQPAHHAAHARGDERSTGSVAHFVIEAVRGVWSMLPLHDATDAAARAARAALRPTAQRHPLGLMLGALLMGGLLVWSRPWRWLLGPALSTAWMPQLLLWAITQRPIRSWPSVAASPAQPRRSAASQPQATPP